MTGMPWLDQHGVFRCFYCETPGATEGKDPDAANDDLRQSHLVLWSRPRPDGACWSFEPTRQRGWYLRATEPRAGEPNEWSIGSDNFATTHGNALPDLAKAIPGYENGHLHDFCTIGGYLPFPDGHAQTRPTAIKPRKFNVNQAKGMERRISDRIDLTLEAIRLYYVGITDREANPLGDVLDAYGWFFDAFGIGPDGFDAYVDYFYLSPLVSDGQVIPLYGETIRFDDALPRDESKYYDYIAAQRTAVLQRNDLIVRSWSQPQP